jgi:hypothetical protein
MMQVVFGAALGCIVGQGVLYTLKFFVGRLSHAQAGGRSESAAPLRGQAFLAGFIKYAGVLGVCGALITLGVWTVGDYLAAKAARTAKANTLSVAPPVAPPAAVEEVAGLAPVGKTNSSPAAGDPDPYANSEFKVQRPPHRAGAPLNLKEKLLQRSEDRARADLLRQIQQHIARSQYDCEAADRASKYLKADLDVWGFAAWQLKYFPTDNYKGATLPECKDIQSVVDPSVSFAANRRG